MKYDMKKKYNKSYTSTIWNAFYLEALDQISNVLAKFTWETRF